MTTLDSLPADQRAVLSLLLRQGRSYEDIAGMLQISEAAVRERAHGALAALGPDGGDLSARRRAEIGDWLLRQGPEDERTETEAFLGRSEAGRAWAGAVAGALEPLGGDGLPKAPGAEAPGAASARTGAGPAPGPAPAPPKAGGSSGSATARPRVSRTGGAILLAVVALLIAGGVAVALLTGGDEGGDDDGGASATTTQAQPQVIAQVNLKPPSGAPARGALGIVQVVKQNQQQAILVRAQGLPRLPSKSSGYGVWLSSSPSKRVWLGYGNYKADDRTFTATGAVTEDVTDYGEVFVTRQIGEGPERPGTIYLRGPVRAGGG